MKKGKFMRAAKPGPDYQAFLLRCWREPEGWRFSLEEVGGGARHGFTTADALLAFLLAQLAGGPWASDVSAGRGG